MGDKGVIQVEDNPGMDSKQMELLLRMAPPASKWDKIRDAVGVGGQGDEKPEPLSPVAPTSCASRRPSAVEPSEELPLDKAMNQLRGAAPAAREACIKTLSTLLSRKSEEDAQETLSRELIVR